MLEAQGVARAYGVSGESYLPLLDSLGRSSIDVVTCRHEGGAGLMAVAESRLTGKLTVCTVSRGPGSANAALAKVKKGGVSSTQVPLYSFHIDGLTAQQANLAFVFVHADDIIAALCEAGPCHQPDVPRAHDGDLHPTSSAWRTTLRP